MDLTISTHLSGDLNHISPSEQRSLISQIRYFLELPSYTSPQFSESLPFSLDDVTAGCEDELQAVVMGNNNAVDLPITISTSSYYKNISRRAASGDTSQYLIRALDDYLNQNTDNVWENSWVRFPRVTMSPYANSVLDQDLLADKRRSNGPNRQDASTFLLNKDGQQQVRVPVSYFLKLCLADVIGTAGARSLIRSIGTPCLKHFLNDNSSPETFSFHPIPVSKRFHMGQGLAEESLRRYLLCQTLAMYGNVRFKLLETGQEAQVYFSPNPPLRQKSLNDSLSDAFYRELFMSPCLSGWDEGEKKHRYMHLCHEVLSRSHLNAVSKLKEASIITRNLVVLPNISNVSLANNGTHISLGSKKVTRLMAQSHTGFDHRHEKYLGDMVIKIVEHFLPLFVGTYSASPHRMDFWDFHPEKALGYLPHELDFTHLRMIWRRWKKKAKLKFCGHPITPFGPEWLDRCISKMLRLKGDFVVDFRLIDYLVSLLSTEQSPALDGKPGNESKLKKDLAHMGVFHSNMSLYLPMKLRQFSDMGFSGFEGRHYSVFENITRDMTEATNLQMLIIALAYKYILNGTVSHEHIPDAPSLESERRQIFFGTAIGIPTFFVRLNTRNQFLRHIIKRVKKTRNSRRYPGYLRVHNMEYRKALLHMIKNDGADLVEMFGFQSMWDDLARRIQDPKTYSTAGKLTKGILETAGAASPLKLTGTEFNTAAESYYRNTLRKQHMVEAYNLLLSDCRKLENYQEGECGFSRQAIRDILGKESISHFLEKSVRNMDRLREDEHTLGKMAQLILLTIHCNSEKIQAGSKTTSSHEHKNITSIH